MVNQQLVYYIKSTIAKGYSTNQIYNYLIQQGYNPTEVSQAISMANINSQFPNPRSFNNFNQQPQNQVPNKKSSFLPVAVIGIFLKKIVSSGYAEGVIKIQKC